MKPKVSICIPAYRQPALLRKVLESVRMQTFQDYELIISDDSPDDAVEVLLHQFEFKDKLRYSRNTIPLGSPANWNHVISLANGEYIKMLHTDDFFTSAQSLAKYVALLDNNPHADIAFSASEVWSLSTNEKSVYSCSEKHLKRLQNEPEFLFFKNVIGGPSATIHRNGTKIAYDTNLKWLVDIDFYIGILQQNKHIAYSNEPLICTVDGAEGQITQTVSNDKNIQIKEHVILFNKLLQKNVVVNNSFLLYFKLLFNKYNIKNIDELNKIISIPSGQTAFYERVIASLSYGMALERILVKFYNSSLNKNVLKMEMF